MEVCSGLSPGRRYSGSSLPMISLVQRKWCSQSECGTPRTDEITATGNGAANVSTKSHSPISPLVDEFGGDPLDLLVPGPDRTPQELLVGDLAHGTVLGRVEVDDHLGCHVEL